MRKPNLEEGLDHIRIRASDERIQNSVDAYYATINSPRPALGGLFKGYSAKCLMDLKKNENILNSKLNAYIAGFSRRKVIGLKPFEQAYSQGFDLLYPLISDNQELLHWHSQYQLSNFFFDRKAPRALNPEKYEYHSVQPRLALQKDWETLVERSEFILKNPPKKNKYYLIDHQFYIALAKGDTVAMEQAIHELVSPKVARHRNNELQWGLEERLINGWGVILSKLAYHLGYELNIDSPWIPQEWLPVEPLAEYKLPYEFLSDFDLFTPFQAKEGLWCGDVVRFSPRPPSEKPLSFSEIREVLLGS